MDEVSIDCMSGCSAGRPVLLGFARADTLHALSFADVLDEATGRGYQRRVNIQHSLDFRRYIQRDESATIPLTFNLRPGSGRWRVRAGRNGRSRLIILPSAGRPLAQVDCQHRLGHLSDLAIILPFMSFIGLSAREEMEVFNVINSKARGLSASLLDFHDAQLAIDLASERPELYIALFLKNEPTSPWYRQLDLGGGTTSGLARRASLRTLQKAIKVFLARTRILRDRSPDTVAQIVLSFWAAVALVLPEAWSKPRKHLLTKGIGVYAMMEVAADLCADARPGTVLDKRYFAASLADFAADLDWSSEGPLRGLGGEGGVKAALVLIRSVRQGTRLKVVVHG
ncbi:DGQHR domain-containing protein [Methylorubrum thiocyanatum]|uniref:DGQHR domain-containing protein n=1 Tax=Methylorubrum thiocyanatum TaxID=47958 RepID=UPI003F7FA906